MILIAAVALSSFGIALGCAYVAIRGLMGWLTARNYNGCDAHDHARADRRYDTNDLRAIA